MNIFYIIITVATLVAMLAEPAAALSAAQSALDSWWNKVLPALLPFFIISELCSRVGLINLLGVWLTPIMQPLFRLNGTAAIGLLLGFFSGSPTGGAVAANLRTQDLISRNEGERMLAFCNNVGPLYLLITVSALLGEPAVGMYLAAVQYPINLLFGLLLRFFAPRGKSALPPISPFALFGEGIAAFKSTPVRPIAILLKESSAKALTNIGMIGAFMLIFSLLITSLKFFGINRLLCSALSPLCALLNLPTAATTALCDGLFEMTLGIQTLADSNLDLFDKLICAAVILGWSGLSIHIQIAGVCSNSDLRLKYYIPCRLAHALLAPLILLLFKSRITLNSSTWATTNLSPWLGAFGAVFAPAVLLIILLIISFAVNFLSSLLFKLYKRFS